MKKLFLFFVLVVFMFTSCKYKQSPEYLIKKSFHSLEWPCAQNAKIISVRICDTFYLAEFQDKSDSIQTQICECESLIDRLNFCRDSILNSTTIASERKEALKDNLKARAKMSNKRAGYLSKDAFINDLCDKSVGDIIAYCAEIITSKGDTVNFAVSPRDYKIIFTPEMLKSLTNFD